MAVTFARGAKPGGFSNTANSRSSRPFSHSTSTKKLISGSRNGFPPLLMWYAIRSLGQEGLKQRIEESLAVAAYTEEQLKNIGIQAWRNPQALTVVFPQPPQQVRDKWQLASAGGSSHLICMPHIGREQIDELIKDIQATGGASQ